MSLLNLHFHVIIVYLNKLRYPCLSSCSGRCIACFSFNRFFRASTSFLFIYIPNLPRLSVDNKPQRRTGCIAVYRDALLKLYRVTGLVGDLQLQRLTGRYCIG